MVAHLFGIGRLLPLLGMLCGPNYRVLITMMVKGPFVPAVRSDIL